MAKNSKELIISDVEADLSDIADDLYYVPYYPDSRSELCVPLIGKDERILGVINVESQTRDAFDRRHKGMLKALAYQAVIALENIKSKEQRIKTKTSAALGDLYTNMIHDIASQLKQIGADVGSIIEKGDDFSKDKAEKMKLTLNAIFDRAKELKELQGNNEDLQAINIVKLIEEVLSQEFPDNISTTKKLLGNIPDVRGHQLKYVFRHLIQNAVEAMPNGGELSVEASLIEEKNEISVWVQDTGIGIPKEKQEDIFLPYYSTKDKPTWLRGFGLWWVRNYIERQGGRVIVDSEPTKGAKFTVFLPVFNPRK